MGRTLRIAGLVVGWLLLVVYFTYLRFPYTRLRPLLEQRLAALGVGRVSFQEIEATPLGGVRLTAAMWVPPGAPPGAPMTLERLDLAPAILKTLRGARAARFSARVATGTVKGTYAVTKDGHTQVDAKLDQVDLAELAIPGAPEGLAGKLSGTIDVDVEGGNLEAGKGNVHLEAVDGAIPPVAGGMKMKPIAFATLTADAVLDGPKLEITELAVEGPDVEGSGTGTITLRRGSLAASQLKADVRFRIPDTSSVKGLEALIAGFRVKKDAEGYFTLPLQGTLARPMPRI